MATKSVLYTVHTHTHPVNTYIHNIHIISFSSSQSSSKEATSDHLDAFPPVCQMSPAHQDGGLEGVCVCVGGGPPVLVDIVFL